MYRFKRLSASVRAFTAIFTGLIALSGCASSPAPARYPTQLTNVEDFSHYPLEAAGFNRDAITKYSPSTIDISAGYNLFNPDNQIATTLYVYQNPDEMDAVFEKEKGHIARTNEQAELIEESQIKLLKDGIEYDALQATYQYDTNFANKQQPVFSQIILWKYKNKYLKLRSTSPLAQQQATLSKNAELLDAVDWAQ